MTKKSLDTVRKLAEESLRSTLYRSFINRATLCYNFYDNVQWTAEEETALTSRGQIPVVINLLRGRIKGLAGTEITNRHRIRYAPRSSYPDDEATADTLSSLAYHEQDVNKTAFKRSKVFKDSLICGLGVMNNSVYDGKICNERVRPFDFFWDISDMTDDMSNSYYRGQKKWMHWEEVAALFPDKEAELRTKLGLGGDEDGPDPLPYFASAAPGQDYIPEGDINYFDRTRGRVFVIDMEYRCSETAYEFVDSQGRLIRTFDEKVAKKGRITDKQAKDLGWYGVAFREIKAYRYYSVIFCDDLELYHEPSEIAVKPDFDLQVLCIDRTEFDGIPAGPLFFAIDPQKEYNKRRSKMLHALNSVQIIADSNAFENPELMRQEAARPDAMILKRSGADVKIETKGELAKGQLDVMLQSAEEIKQTIGISDDFLGQQTNATSNVAISNRQNSNLRTQAPAFDALKLFMQRNGELLLVQIQSTYTDEMVVKITDDSGAIKELALNKPLVDTQGRAVTKDGKPVMVNDISAGLFDVYVEEGLDVSAERPETLERVSQMMMNGVPVSIGMLMVAGFSEKQATILFKKFNAQPEQKQVLPPDGSDPSAPQGQPAGAPSAQPPAVPGA